MLMDHKEVGHYWDANASAWTRLARSGFDIYRDYLNTPAFFDTLPRLNHSKVWISAVAKGIIHDC